MITITKAAKQQLKQILLANTTDPNEGLRLKITSDQIGLVLDKQSHYDHVIKYDGLKILIIGNENERLLMPPLTFA